MRFGPLVIALALLSSCAPMYVPNVRNAPLFNGKGEFQAAAFIGTGIDLQGALALSDHIGITGNYSFLRETRKTLSTQAKNLNAKTIFLRAA